MVAGWSARAPELSIGVCVLGLATLVSGAPATAADDYAGVPLTRFELVDVYRFCSIAFRPGQSMVPCLIEQAEKIARGKKIQELSRNAEAATKLESGR